MSTDNRKKLGQTLVELGHLSEAQLDVVQRQHKALQNMGRMVLIEELFVRSRFVTRDQVNQAIEIVSGEGAAVSNKILLPPEICKKYEVLPAFVDSGNLVVRSARPLSEAQKERIRKSCEVPVKAVRVLPTDRGDILREINNDNRGSSNFGALLESLRGEEVTGSFLKTAIDTLLNEGLTNRTSDIHLDRKPDPESWVSYRIDNNLRQMHIVPERLMSAIFTRIKSESGMDSSDSRRAQDGRISFEFQGRTIDFRVAAQPILGGETITMRPLDPEALPGLHKMFPGQEYMLQLFEGLANVRGKSGGMIIVSGPTGSGKSTTLNALASKFPRDRVNILTIEDPVEYSLPFARQIQISALTDQKATDVERSILRQDPDVLYFGEIRDGNSCEAALKLTESGHLVMATIHAVSAGQTFERLLSFLPSEQEKHDALYVMAHYMKVALNQVLEKRLCSCKIRMTNDEIQEAKEELEQFEVKDFSELYKVNTEGCHSCKYTGYHGRCAVHETLVFPVDERIRIPLAKKMLEPGGAQRVTELPGIRHITRQKTLGKLMEAGLMDLKTAQFVVGMELIEGES